MAAAPLHTLNGKHRAEGVRIDQRAAWSELERRARVELPSPLAAQAETLAEEAVAALRETASRAGGAEFGALFILARRLMALPGMDSPDDLVPFATAYRDVLLSERVILPAECQRLDWHSDDEVALAFESAWHSVRYPHGQDLLSEAIARAEASPVVLVGEANGLYLRFLAVARELQRARGEEPIVLAVSDSLGSHLGVTRQTIGQLVEKGQRKGHLKIADPHFSFAKHKARTFYYTLPLD